MASPATARCPSAIAWQALKSHIDTWFYRPDFEALEVALCCSFSHHLIDADPVWLFVVGPSSSGKTSIIINSLSDLPDARIMGDLTTKTFISHHGKELKGILQQIGKSGIFLFKDFTTLLSKREDERTEIAAQLREIYDGKWARDTGIGVPPLWEGKVTTIAVCTAALERAWSLKRELGERFVTVRWSRVGGIKMAQAAARQRGHDVDITKATRELGRAVFNSIPRRPLGPLPDEMGEQVAALSEICALLRGSVIRDSHGKRDIIDVPNIEEPGRLNKSLEVLAATHAVIFGRETPGPDDLRIAKRVALDSIPEARSRIFNCLKNGATISRSELVKYTEMPLTSVVWTGEEMAACGVIEMVTRANGEIDFKLTENLLDLSRGVFGDF